MAYARESAEVWTFCKATGTICVQRMWSLAIMTSSAVPSIDMTKPQPALSYMPWNVKQEIIKAVDYKTRISLLQCSRQFKALVDDAKVTYDNFTLHFQPHSVMIRIELITGFYRMIGYHQMSDANFLKSAVAGIGGILENPKLDILEFCVEFERADDVEKRNNLLEHWSTTVNNFRHKILAKQFTMSSEGDPDEIISFLSVLEPVTLKDITFKCSREQQITIDLDLTDIAETDQWKGAESLTLIRFNHSLPLVKSNHFLSVEANKLDISEEELQYVVNIFLRESGWSHRTFHITNYDYPALMSFFARFEALENRNRCIESQFRIRDRDRRFECRVFLQKRYRLNEQRSQQITMFNPFKRPDLKQRCDNQS